ncbi:hypothetical protein EDB85DRAFT_2276409 [Lactarius pseudohatsudake]|nr:hypothetical protein EDB85DRAFT_2276409 [Lactarius pseudohatsudake]
MNRPSWPRSLSSQFFAVYILNRTCQPGGPIATDGGRVSGFGGCLYLDSSRCLTASHFWSPVVSILAQALSRLATRSRGHYELEEIPLNLKRREELEVASVLIRFHTLTGINFIFYFGTTFFTNASIHNPFLVSIATSTISVGMALPGIWGVKRFACCSLARLA